jgi:hypothetical protein
LLQAAVDAYDTEELSRILRATIPEFMPSSKVEETGATIVQFPARDARRTR